MFQCGVFHQIKKKDGFLNEKNIKIMNNTKKIFQFENIYKTFDCDEPKCTWASNEVEPCIVFNLVNRELKMNGFLYSRNTDTFYPTSLEILGWNEINWERIYINQEVYIESEATKTYSFNNDKYFSSFMFKQLVNSNRAKYIEAYKIEFFGTLKNVYHKLKTCKRHQRENNVLVAMIIALWYS